MKRGGVSGISISLDGSTNEIHDSFRRVPGAFKKALSTIKYTRMGKLPFQVNTTISQHNLQDLPNILNLVTKIGATAWDIFMLVPTGRGKVDMEISPEQYEETLDFVYKSSLISKIPIKMTCSPHYNRVRSQRIKERSIEDPSKVTEVDEGIKRQKIHLGRGCMAGNGYCFISHIGKVYGCGFLPISAGDIRNQDFKKIYLHSKIFEELRNRERLQGKCGSCEYRNICGGCRARAYSIYGNLLSEEPFCTFEPKRKH